MPFLHNDVYGNIFKKDKLDLALQIYSFAPLIFQNQLDILDYTELIKNAKKVLLKKSIIEIKNVPGGFQQHIHPNLLYHQDYNF